MKRIQLENRTDLKSEIPLEAPYSIFIDPSSACNFACKFCMNSKIKDKEIMDFILYKKIIDDLYQFDNPIKVIRLYGFGEPLLNKNFCNMVSYAKQNRNVLSVDTTTNASLLTPELSKQVVNSGIDRINISIEAMNDEKYREFTGNNSISFQKIVDNITHLYSILENTVIFVKIAGDYLTEEEKELFIETFAPISDGCDIEHSMNCWYDHETDENKEVGIYGQPIEQVETCPYIFYSMMIQSNGQVSLCFLDWNKKMIIGDVKEQRVKNIWNSYLLYCYRMDMLNGIKNEICSNCSQLTHGMPVNLDPYKKQLIKRMKK